MPGTLTTFHGLPGSGKTTLALRLFKQLQESGIPVTRVNRDDIRTEVAGEAYHATAPQKEVEKKVKKLLDERILAGLVPGGIVLSDDTHMNPRAFMAMRQLASAGQAKLAHIFVDVPVAEAHRRNRGRGAAGGRLVPGAVIERMAENAYTEDRLTINQALFIRPGEAIMVHSE